MESVSSPFLINGYELKTSLSIGISQSPKDGQSVELLMKNAAFAMNRAKKKVEVISSFTHVMKVKEVLID